MRRVVTGHAAGGKSVFVSDGEPPRVAALRGMPDPGMVEVWATEGIPPLPPDEGDPTVEMSSLVPGPGATRFRICHMLPAGAWDQARKEGVDLEAARREYAAKTPGLAEAMEPKNPGMHTTDTVDYGVVISGEIWLELDDGEEVHLKQGDCVVQNGTRHAWRNRGSQTCVMAFVMVGAKRR